MINTSNAYKQQIENDNRNFIEYADITLLDGTVLNLTNKDIWAGGFSIEDAVSGSDSFQIGSAIINKLTLTLNNMYGDFEDINFDGAVVQAAVGLRLENGNIEKLQKGQFNVDDPKRSGALITLECLDNMAKFDRPYSESTLSYPATRGQILRDACGRCGVVLSTVTFDGSDSIVQARPDDEALTFRQVIAWVAQLSCKWARCNTLGQLELIWFDENALMAEAPEQESYHDIRSLNGSPTVADDDVVVTGIKVVVEDTEGTSVEYLAGNEGYILSIEGNKLIQQVDGQTVASVLGEKLIGLRFRPINVSCLSDPSREAGDIMIITDRKGRSYRGIITETKFSNGNYQQISCDAETPSKNSSRRYSETTKTYLALRKLIKQEKTDRELAIENLNKVLENSSGLYPTYEKQPDGSTITYFHDKPTLAESKNVIKITADAVGVSNDGGKTYPFGFFLTGTMITKLLYAEGINADYIDAGAITVKDQQGKIIFQADFATGRVIISADNVMIGSKNLTDELKDIKTLAESAGNVSMMLSNDYEAVPVNKDGEYSKFPDDVTTTAQVTYGTTDVTEQCIFTVQESSAITGLWDAASKTYKATELKADTGWVDIRATYLNTLFVTKRFTVAKLYAGADGEPGRPGQNGRTYALEASVPIIKITKENTIDPSSIIFNSYCLEGADAGRVAYAGRFQVRETVNGTSWSTIYQSAADESTLTHVTGTMIVDVEGNAVVDISGNPLIFPRSLSEIEVTLYADGGFEHVIDIVRIPVVKDVTALTQKDVFNILTNNGQAKGFYQIGDELYINATYIASGMLADRTGKNYWNLDTGEFHSETGVFSGTLSAAKGTFAGGLSAATGTFKGTVSAGRIEGSVISGSSFDTTTQSGNGKIHLEKGEIDFYNYDADFTHAGTIRPGIADEIPDEIGMQPSTTATLELDANRSFTLMINGEESIRAYRGSPGNPIIEIFGTLYSTSNGVDVAEIASKGKKSRIVENTRFGSRYMYCYETPTPMFADIGTGQTNKDGMALVDLDPIFLETVNSGIEYQVFIQKEGAGDLWVDCKDPDFFVVKGTPNLKFSWEVKCLQSNFEDLRLDDYELINQQKNFILNYDADTDQIIEEAWENYDKDVEEMINYEVFAYDVEMEVLINESSKDDSDY